MSETFQQGGMALGIAAFGALFQDRVTRAFAAVRARRLSTGALGKQIASGAARQITAASRIPGLAAAARHAFVSGLAYTLPAPQRPHRHPRRPPDTPG
jgi:hypothetical protein